MIEIVIEDDDVMIKMMRVVGISGIVGMMRMMS